MPITGYLYTPQYLAHDTGPHHPERPDRLRAIQDRLQKSGVLSLLEPIMSAPVDPEMLERVHSRSYIERLKLACERGERAIDSPDCPICRQTYDIALLAAGGVLRAVDAVMMGQVHNAFCAIRPPGHHAERTTAMGFCFFNNTAIAAEYLRSRHRLQRVAILDWDVHHCNGTQHHFEADPSVFVCSVHQDPRTLFPGTGYADETGIGEGAGFTLNLPMAPGSGDEDYRAAFQDHILPRLLEFEPEFLLLSVGFDPHRDDPLAQVRLSTGMFDWMTSQATAVAAATCGGRIVSILEGGYALSALADSVQVHVEALGEAP